VDAVAFVKSSTPVFEDVS